MNEYLETIVSFITILGFPIIIYQLYLANRNMAITSKWNKLASIRDFLDLDERAIPLKNEAKRLVSLLFDKDSKLSIHEVYAQSLMDREKLDQIYENDEIKTLILRQLNSLEKFCAAYQIGALDRELGFHMFGASISANFFEYENFIKMIRHKIKEPACFVELEKTANEFRARLELTRESRLQELNSSLNNKGLLDSELLSEH